MCRIRIVSYLQIIIIFNRIMFLNYLVVFIFVRVFIGYYYYVLFLEIYVWFEDGYDVMYDMCILNSYMGCLVILI
jgi:hypothetical protein